MQIISSGRTFLMKRVFPAFWFGILALFALSALLSGDTLQLGAFLLIPVLMALFGFVLMRKLVWDLADEVHDGGDFLLVRRGKIEERVRLSNVVNISMSQFTNPPRLTLRLRQPGQFGDEVVFIPQSPLRINPFARNELAERLMQRVDRQRHPGATQ